MDQVVGYRENESIVLCAYGGSRMQHERDRMGVAAFLYPRYRGAMKRVLLSRPDAATPSAAGKAPNALVPLAIAAAFFDATGKPERSLPLRPDNVKAILRT
jgi:hypothetical protein